jgi:hypothetical protein
VEPYKNTHCITLILTGWMARVPSPAEAKDFSCSLCVQTSYEENQASYPMGTRGHFPEVYRGRGMMLTIHPHLLPWSRMSKSYTSSPLSACMVCSWIALLFLTYYSNTDYTTLTINKYASLFPFKNQLTPHCLIFLES